LRQWLLFGLILLIKAVARLPTTHLLVVPVSGLPGHPLSKNWLVDAVKAILDRRTGL
jgi:hypothetical protein